MTEFTDAEREEWFAMRRDGIAIDDGRGDATDATCSHCGNLFAAQTGMVTDGFALCAACDGD